MAVFGQKHTLDEYRQSCHSGAPDAQNDNRVIGGALYAGDLIVSCMAVIYSRKYYRKSAGWQISYAIPPDALNAIR